MIKKIGYAVIFIVLIFIGIQLLTDKPEKSPDLNQPSDSIESGSESEEGQTDEAEILLNEVYVLAEQGKIPNAAIIAGETEIEEVTKQWGKPEVTSKSENGIYTEYPKHNINFGYQGNLIFDVRSFDSRLHGIHFQDIKQFKGEPDDIRYYSDDAHDQVILVYQLTTEYQLKWILPNPSEKESNPPVHHISVVAQVDDDKSETDEIIQKMSLDEKIGQMIFGGVSGIEVTKETKKLIAGYNIGGFILYENNMESPESTIDLLNQIKQTNKQNSLPVLLGVDQEGGRVSKLPGDLVSLPASGEVGRKNDKQYSYEIGTVLGKQLQAFGFNLNFAPVMDVNSNPDNPVIGDRSFGENPEIVSNFGIETMKGIQSQNIISVIKHFPGHGDTKVDSHLQLPTVNKSLKELQELELIPFEHVIENGADVVMTAHILMPEIDPEFPASMSEKIITGILRKDLDFNGVVITDDMTMKAITNNFDIGSASVQSVKAGSDIILVAHHYKNIVSVIDAIKAAVKNGEITEERIDESVSRIIELKKKYELDNEKVKGIDIKKLNQTIKNVLN
ncbi:beta-N-acetylhexosaminidase [Virgibacillus indicus]|uniref:beta-N-acetylhexosaminidase n=1 Tax=Virgibacillus indicus TaxID=2024554 RepID=A0A265NBT1_9BACI|nr:beta-N-acetylhexosaminidase [Virgibacillus indicus]OZU88919.1 beta-N-acetylhexosaminidase [Virgibacillus indicus]